MDQKPSLYDTKTVYDTKIANSIEFAYALGSLEKETITLEAQLSGDAANDTKRMHREMKRNNIELQCNISDCTTKGTKVRIEVLKAITNKFKNDEEKWTITMFEPKPVIKVTNIRTRQEKILNYQEAVRRFGDKLTQEDLKEAYETAGSVYEHEMTCTFVVLKDEHMIRHQKPGPSSARLPAAKVNAPARSFAGAFAEQHTNNSTNIFSKNQTRQPNTERTYDYEYESEINTRGGRRNIPKGNTYRGNNYRENNYRGNNYRGNSYRGRGNNNQNNNGYYNKYRNSYNKDENEYQRQKGQKRQGDEPSEFNGTANWAKRKLKLYL
jgi:hypothetical protein